MAQQTKLNELFEGLNTLECMRDDGGDYLGEEKNLIADGFTALVDDECGICINAEERSKLRQVLSRYNKLLNETNFLLNGIKDLQPTA